MYGLSTLFSIAVPLLCNVRASDQKSTDIASYTPVSFHLGKGVPSELGAFQHCEAGAQYVLNSSSPVLTLDYGAEVAGFPYIDIAALTGDFAQVELKYSEPYDGLSLPYGDGPWYVLLLQPRGNRCLTLVLSRLFVNGLMNSFRTETFNITAPGQIESFFLQGGQRWQSIKLLTDSSITISEIGFRPSVDIQPTDELIGSFSSSNSKLDSIWALGARAVQAACVEAHSQPSTGEITDQGALIRGQYPAYSAKGLDYGNYTMSFSTKIVTGGTGWRVAAGANDGYGPYFVLTTAGPHFVNNNNTLLPLNSLTVGFGFSIVNQTILPSAPIVHFPVALEIVDDVWYRITTEITSTGYDISINGSHVAFVDNAQFKDYINPSWGSPTATDGTWGFAPFLDQAAYFTDVEVTSSDGETLYSNVLTNPDILADYRVAENRAKVCLDGAKRDRLIWIGDFAHTARMLAASTGRCDFIKSMIEYEFQWQLTRGDGAGLVPIQEAMGDGRQFRYKYFPSQYGENDYYIFFLLTIGDYYALTEDQPLMRNHWQGIQALVKTLVEMFLDPRSGLLADPDDVLWFTAQGAQNATAPTALFVIALRGLLPIAHALGDADAVRH